MLVEDPRVPATVIAQRLRQLGYRGSLTILEDHLRRVRPKPNDRSHLPTGRGDPAMTSDPAGC
jgi:hypothetical protein